MKTFFIIVLVLYFFYYIGNIVYDLFIKKEKELKDVSTEKTFILNEVEEKTEEKNIKIKDVENPIIPDSLNKVDNNKIEKQFNSIEGNGIVNNEDLENNSDDDDDIDLTEDAEKEETEQSLMQNDVKEDIKENNNNHREFNKLVEEASNLRVDSDSEGVRKYDLE